MSTEDDSAPQDPKEPRPVTVPQLRLRATCKKRYGRASLTIRRWGGLHELVGKSEVAQKINAFRAGKATAEDVAWSFVRARVEGHSPTFRWKDAQLDRLIPLVTDCSESPKFKSTTAGDLAQELVKAQDEIAESLKRLSEQFSQTFDSVRKLPTLLSPGLTDWAERNQRTFAALSRSLHDARLISPFAGLTAAQRRKMFPVLQPTPFQTLAGLQRLDLRIRLPVATFGELTKSLRHSLDLYGTQTVPAALLNLTQRQSVPLADLFAATQAAAELVQREGDDDEAAELLEMSDEAADVVANPSTERLEQMVTDFSERLTEFRARYEADEEKRDRQYDDMLVLTLFLFFLQIYLGFFQELLDQLAKS